MIPILILFLIGFSLGRITGGKNLSLSKLSTWVLSTAIIFVYLNDHPAGGWDFFTALLVNSTMMAVVLILWKSLRPRDYHSKFLSTAFCNTGYIGYPVVKSFLGDVGLSKAVVFSTVHTIFMITLGVFIAGLGGKRKEKILDGLIGMLKLPWVYAMILAFVMNTLGKSWREFPYFVREPISMLVDSAIPIIIITVGVELSRIKPSTLFLKDITILTFFKLFLTPLIVLAILYVLRIDGIMGKVMIMESAMPTAMTTVLVATETDADPELISMVVFTTTFLSFLTLSMWGKLIT
ncbi:MAG TPA: AEC family transporter [Thermotogales bacterium]|nr:AEC family transporter [Thermotogales bacterium]